MSAPPPEPPPPPPVGFDVFVRSAYPGLVRLGALLSGDAHHGEDLAQSALVHTLRAWHRLHPDGDPAAYTRTVMTRLAAKAGRRRWRGERPTEHVAMPEPTAAAGPGRSADDVDAALDARRLLAQLPAQQRLALVLRFWLDLSEAQTADVLQCSVGTVKSRTSRGLAALRATAPARGGDDDERRGTTTDLSSWTGVL